MKTSIRYLLLSLLAGAGMTVSAATLPNAVSLHLRPDADSPTIGTLPAGQSVNPLIRDELAEEGVADLPSGWLAMRHSGPFFGFVHNNEMGKDLTARPGAVIRSRPSRDAAAIATVETGQRADAVDLAGEWTQVVFRDSLIVYFNMLPEPASTVRAESPPRPQPAPPPASQPIRQIDPEPLPVQTRSDYEADSGEAAPRTFEGYLVKVRRILGRGPRLDYQLVDENNNRIALLDLSALLITEPLDGLENRLVQVYGPGTRIEGVRAPVIRVETLRLAN